ncbi:ABC transporter permease [Aestuariispira insulae]|uniref:Amino acid ABC transporter membrane protein 1 (PAAT family) n=1 Tax=Aestuariispira insulae TaxID=1461337 RepID=A0A3D9HIB9_9PROT|nr:ABC transporter permease subunit [Aestuariispira insulae]RED49184.1 amino acid ABC transporter membrane protein 1 (PAAT family) [Aestuariispira insulae]
METVIDYSPAILRGTGVTIFLAICSLMVSMSLGLIAAWGKLSSSPIGSRVANSYTTLIRGVPDLVLMMLIYFGLQRLLNFVGDYTGLWGYIEINTFVAGFVTIGFVIGAYMTETFRGAILAIPRGQIEAGIACGMSKSLIFRRIIWPHLVRLALPSFTNNWLVLLKTTALVSVIGQKDLVYEAFTAGRSTRQLFTFMFVVLIIYLIMTAASQTALGLVERRYNVGVRRA